MWPSILHSLGLAGAHCPCLSAACFPGCLCGTAGHLADPSPVAGTFYWNWSGVHHWPPLGVCHQLLASWHTPKFECTLKDFPLVFLLLRLLWFWLSAELTWWLPGLTCSFWSLHRWASSETCGVAQRPTVTDRSVKPDLMVWPKWPNPIIFFFFLVQIQILSKAREGLLKA